MSFFYLFPKSRSMTSHHVTCHVTTVTCLFIIKIIRKEKEKKNQKKRNIKSRKIDKKMLVSKHTITTCV